MADILVDNTLFEDFRKGDGGAKGVIDTIIDGEVTAAISPLTVFHLWNESEMDRRTEIAYSSILTFMEEAPFTIAASRQAGLWIASAEADQRGRLVYFAMLAATAKERGEVICTRNSNPYSSFYSNFTAY
ncbi:MAG: hypothetical protein BZY79_03270 [SAR202 cluster bacterium Casp-Chloro-G4]|nr:hypothetical protein [Chloroflexota bacterium]MDA1227789.1 hypothetical protein [Chloroflexota bacterium]PKB61584.1 MAG: hypothetical protein BZY79_03270 [SAR202 cluster bacterium Casp-Chloro-G4]